MLQFGFDASIFRRQRGFRLPEGIVPAQDHTAGQWIESRLQPWGLEGVPLRSLLPDTFPAYARIFHPFYSGDDETLAKGEEQPVHWSTVAEWTGATIHPLMQLEGIARVPFPYHVEWGRCPEMGSIPVPESTALTGLLRDFTTTPDDCYLGYWEGNGFFHGGRIYYYGGGPGLMTSIEDLVRNLWKKLRPVPNPLANIPKLVACHREYLLFYGSLETVPSLSRYPPWGQSPNLWWPEDRAWCVATDIDSYDTYVGGSDACIEQILKCPDLEALPVSIDSRIDGDADMVNT